MSARPRNIADPLVRRVGFVTPGAEDPPQAAPQGPVLQQGSPAPVMIPPSRHNSGGLAAEMFNKPTQGGPGRFTGWNPEEPALGSFQEASLLSSSVGAPSTIAETAVNISPRGAQQPPVAASVPSPGSGAARYAAPSNTQQPPIVSTAPAVAKAPVDSAQPPKAGAGPPADAPPPKPKPTKAERRAKQEAEKAAKAAGVRLPKGTGSIASVRTPRPSSGGNSVAGSVAGSVRGADKTPTKAQIESGVPSRIGSSNEKKQATAAPAPRMQFDDKSRVAKANTKKSLVEQTETKNRVELFRHLPQYVYGTQLPSAENKFFNQDPGHPHPAVYQVGLRYLTGDIVGANARCVAMLRAFRELIKDYTTPAEKTLVRDLTAKVNSHVAFLITCRPLAISMGNAIKLLKARILKLPAKATEAEAKATLIADIDKFIQEKIVFADTEIVRQAAERIKDGDILLTHGCSHVVELIFNRAHHKGRRFRVVVVDSRPKLEGRELLRRLLEQGIQCTYAHVNALCYIMREVNRVFLGAASVLANGTVISRVGSATTAMVAHAFRVPVLICCETYKFHERVQLDSICANELGDPDALVKVPGREELRHLVGWADNENLQLLNLTYDAMPAEYVAMIITELGMVPPTSVPVILREYRKESNAIALL